MKLRKIIALLLTLTMIATVLFACANETPDDPAPPAQNDVADNGDDGGDDGAEVDSDDPFAGTFGGGVTLSLAALEGWFPAVTMGDNLPVWQEFERRTGVIIDWEVFSDYDTAMMPRIAAGADLPDMMLIPPAWGNSGVFTLARDGIIIQLDDLIANYAPDITYLLDNDAHLRGLLTAPDGNIYTIADTPKFVNDVVASALFIRQDWLDELGLPVPSTVEEWYNTLHAFSAMGDDIIPFSGINLGGGCSFFGSSFGLNSWMTAWGADADGVVFNQFASDEYRELLTFLNRMYEGGLMDRELTRDEPNFQSLVSTNTVGAFATLAGYLTMYNNLIEGLGVHTLVMPPPDQNGDIRITKRDPTWSHYGITRDSNHPEIAIQWMNYVWGSDEGVILNEFGLEGKTFEFDENGDPQFTDFVLNNPDGLDMYNALRSLGASNTMMVRTPMAVYLALQAESEALPFEIAMVPYRVEPFPAPMSTPEEQAILDRILPDFNTYISEMRVRFITGGEPLANWDEYIQTLERIGLAELTEVQQARFDRATGR